MNIKTITTSISNLFLIKKVNEIIQYLNAFSSDVENSQKYSVQYDNKQKDTITLSGESGTRITNLQSGELKSESTDAVTGGQVFDYVSQQIEENASLYTLTKEGNQIILTDKDGIKQCVEDSDTTYELATTEIDGLYPAADKQLLAEHEEKLETLISSQDTFVAITDEEIKQIIAQ